jgi:hypothetical protein
VDIKTLAAQVRNLQNDEAFCYIMKSIKKDQANIFLNPTSSLDERESAHEIVRGLSKIEDRIATILMDEAIFDKKHQ